MNVFLAAATGFANATPIEFANGTQDSFSQALVVVDPQAPQAGLVTIEPPGSIAGGVAEGFAASFDGIEVSNARQKLAVYFKGGRLHKLDLEVTSGVPAPQQLSSLSTTDVCGSFGSPTRSQLVSALTDPLRSWIFYSGPGADATCGTSDDVTRAVRMDMDATTAARTVPGELLQEVEDGQGRFTGFLFRNRNRLELRNADLGSPRLLFTINAATFSNVGIVSRSAGSPQWFFVEEGQLFGVDLADPTTRTPLMAVSSAQVLDRPRVVDGSGAYLIVRTGSPAATRIFRLADAATPPQVVAELDGDLRGLEATPTRLVVAVLTFNSTDGTLTHRVLSIDRVTEGAPTELQSVTSTSSSVGIVTSGETVFATYGEDDAVTTVVVGSDGSGLQILAQTDVVDTMDPEVLTSTTGSQGARAILLREGIVGGRDGAGGTLRSVDGALQTLATYGDLPASPAGLLRAASVGPIHFGQSGLLEFKSLLPVQASDVFFYDSDAAGLVRLTNNLPAQAPGAGTAMSMDAYMQHPPGSNDRLPKTDRNRSGKGGWQRR